MENNVLEEWVDEMSWLIEFYEKIEDQSRANAFSESVAHISNHAKQFNLSIENENDVDKMFKGLPGVGRSTLDLFKEFIKTGQMKRLEDARKASKPLELDCKRLVCDDEWTIEIEDSYNLLFNGDAILKGNLNGYKFTFTYHAELDCDCEIEYEDDDFEEPFEVERILWEKYFFNK